MHKFILSFLISLTWALNTFAQGPLTPSAAPTPTMKTLDQVEPRVPIPGGNASFTIKNPGSYYLTGDLTNTIFIITSDVTLDLMGFRIVPPIGDGISFAGAPQNVAIRNGSISGAQHGVFGGDSGGLENTLEAVRAQDCTTSGFSLGNGWVVQRCIASNNKGDGVRLTGASTVEDSIMNNNLGDGIQTTSSATIRNNHMEHNQQAGIRISGEDNIISGNTVRGNGDNYFLLPGNLLNLMLYEVPEIIEWPCAITFSGTLSSTNLSGGANGLTIDSERVSIDLNGHALIGPGTNSNNSGIAMTQNGKNISIKNGTISHWGENGIYVDNVFGVDRSRSISIEDVIVFRNRRGIFSETGGVHVRNGIAHANAQEGIHLGLSPLPDQSTILNTASTSNGTIGIVIYNGLVENATAHHNESGFHLYNGSQAKNCLAHRNEGAGFTLLGQNKLLQSKADRNGIGIHVPIGISLRKNLIDNNYVADNIVGIQIDAIDNIIVRNTASGNSSNYMIVTNNHVGTLSTTPVGAGAWDNFDF